MCRRYFRRGEKQEIADHFKADKIQSGLPDLLTSYNVAPTTHQPVIRHSRDGSARKLLLMRWGLVPYFAKSLADYKGMSTFNAKAESVETANTWREPFTKGRRCLVPADGYYEWKVLDPEAKKPAKQPYAFTVPDQPVFAFAGLWDLVARSAR
ncbi:MAG: SOS response-associated peptidase [Janthinobacterium lividum]